MKISQTSFENWARCDFRSPKKYR